MIKSAEIKRVLYRVADRFGQRARQTIICQCEGKHLLEIGLILRRIREGIRILDVGGGMGINLLCLNELKKHINYI